MWTLHVAHVEKKQSILYFFLLKGMFIELWELWFDGPFLVAVDPVFLSGDMTAQLYIQEIVEPSIVPYATTFTNPIIQQNVVIVTLIHSDNSQSSTLAP